MLALLALARWSLEAPPVSAARAEALLSTHAALFRDVPRPTGSAEAAAARDRVAAALEAAGCPVERQVAWSCGGSTCARVENLWCRVGPEQGPAVVGMAHTDSVAAGPGAADDGAGVVAWVEAVRGLDPASLRRPLVILLTDGEELGLLGARAWFAAPPVEVGVVVNLEARGSTGAAFLFQTVGPGLPWGALAATLPTWPRASSLYPAVYERLPNDTDLSVVRARGLPGVNHAFLGELAHYHTPLDDRAHLDPRSLAHHADLAAGWIRALQAPTDGPRDVFADLFGLGLSRWPRSATPLLAGLASALALGFVLVDRRAGRTTWAGLAGAAGAAAAATAAAVGAAEALGAAVAAVGAGWWAWPEAVGAGAAALTAAAWCGTGAAGTPHARWSVAVLVQSLTALAAAATEPALAALALPGLGIALAARGLPGDAGLSGALVGAAVGWGPLAVGLQDALGARHPAVVALPLSLSLLGASPFAPARPLRPALGCAAAGLLLAAAAAFGPANPERPRPVVGVYTERGGVARLARRDLLDGAVTESERPALGLPTPAVTPLGPGAARVVPARGGALWLPAGCAVDGVAGPVGTAAEWWGAPPEGVTVTCPGSLTVAEITPGLPPGVPPPRGPGEVPAHRGDRTVVGP